MTYFRDVADYGLMLLAVLFLLRRWKWRVRWPGIVAGDLLLTASTMFLIEALMRPPAGGGRAFRTWPFAYPNYGPSLAFWVALWAVALWWWVPRSGPARGRARVTQGPAA